jgi:acetyl esterase
MSRSIPIPSELSALMADVGPRWGSDVSGHVRLMIERFSAVQKDCPKDGVRVMRDVTYGDHPRQEFDVYLPEREGPPRPAVLFVHGGAFIEGHRNRSDEIYANVHYYLARNGVVGVNIGYRLADDSPYPAATLDIGSVMERVQRDAGDLNIDPDRIFLMGHSAGGAHAGSYAYDSRLHPADGPGLAGLVIVSGRVRADVLPENPNAAKVRAYYGDDESRFDDLSPVSHVSASSVPTFIAMAQYENPLIDVHCLELANRLTVAKRRAPPVIWLRGHNHTSIIAHINTKEDRLGQAILDFIGSPT